MRTFGLKTIFTIVSAFLFADTMVVHAQGEDKVWFVDGYHGGYYGHYPMETYTRFMTDQLTMHPDWRVCLEIEPETWDYVKEMTPEAYRDFQKVAQTERVEFTNPAYAQPYMYNISGESIIRQLAYGIKKVNEHFPSVTFSTYAVEEPCFTSCLPAILKSFGFKYASLKCPNTCWGGYTSAYGGELVNWIGYDGSSILTSPRHACEGAEKNSVWQTTAWGNDKGYIDACRAAGIKHPVGMTYQDAGWTYGPWIGYGDKVKNSSIYVTWKEYFEKVTDGKTSDDWHFTQEDVHPGLVWGSQVMQVLARQVRATENNLIMTEKLGLMANLRNGFTYPQADIDEAWRTLMLSQHHDSWIVPYNRLNDKGTWADNIALWTGASDKICDGIVEQGMASFSPKNKNGLTVKVFNTLGTARKDVVRALLPVTYKNVAVYDYKGRKTESEIIVEDGCSYVAFIADVPAFGYADYTVRKVSSGEKSAPAIVEKEGKLIMENDMYRIVFDLSKGGTIESLVAKTLENKDFVDNGAKYSFGELSGFFYDECKFRSSKDSEAKAEILADGLMEKKVRISGTVAETPFNYVISLKAGEPEIDFELCVDWNKERRVGRFGQTDAYANPHRAFYDDRYKLNFFFPAALGDRTDIVKDAPFDVFKSGLDNTFFCDWNEIKNNVILHWIDVEGVESDYGMACFQTIPHRIPMERISRLRLPYSFQEMDYGGVTTKSADLPNSVFPLFRIGETGKRAEYMMKASSGMNRCMYIPTKDVLRKGFRIWMWLKADMRYRRHTGLRRA